MVLPMIPVLYDAKEKKFDTEGIGALTDAISCTVTEERNSTYELEMEYAIDGIHYEDLQLGNIILATHEDSTDKQAFRIYQITRPIDKVVTVLAEHISYQLSNIPVAPFKATGIAVVLNGLVENSIEENPFSIWTDDENTTSTYTQEVPSSFRKQLGGVTGSVLDVFGGEYEWDMWTVKHSLHRGEDRGVVIEYGKNLIDVEQEELISNVVTGIVPYWKDSDGNLVMLSEKVVESSYADRYPFKRTEVYDFSQDFDEQPTEEQLRARCESYMKSNLIGLPEISVNADFINLADTEEYKDFASEIVKLCDTVTIRFLKLGIDVTAKITKLEYDVLADRTTKISIGTVRTNLVNTISKIENNSNAELDKVFQDNTNTRRQLAKVNKELKEVNETVTEMDKEVDDIAKDGIITEAEKASIRKILQTIEKEKEEVDETYNDLLVNSNLKDTPKQNLVSAYTNAFGGSSNKYKTLLSKIDAVLNCETAEDINTALEAYKSAYSEYSTAVSSYEVALVDAQASVAEMYTDEKIKSQAETFKENLKQSLDEQKQLMDGATGGYKVENYRNGKPFETVYGDTDDLSTMKNVLRINDYGIAFSQNGYSGSFTTAWTIDGKFNTDYLKATTIEGVTVKAGTISGGLIEGAVFNMTDAMYFYRDTDYQGKLSQASATITSYYVGESGGTWAEKETTATYYGASFDVNLFNINGNMISLQSKNYPNTASIKVFQNVVQIGSVYKDGSVYSTNANVYMDGANLYLGTLGASNIELLGNRVTAPFKYGDGYGTGNVVVSAIDGSEMNGRIYLSFSESGTTCQVWRIKEDGTATAKWWFSMNKFS